MRSADSPPLGGQLIARLVELTGPHAGREHALGVGHWRLGRGRGVEVQLDDADVSREHARIEVDAHGARIVDLDSKNGVEVEGRRVEGSAELDEGTRLRLGELELRFHHEAARVRRGLREAGELTITRARRPPEAPPPVAPWRLWGPLLATLGFGLLALGLAIWGR